jgi:hypothetical protein
VTIQPAVAALFFGAAPRLAIRDMERAGIDSITDGEIRRESYAFWASFAIALCCFRPPRSEGSGGTHDHSAAISGASGLPGFSSWA